MKNRPFSLRIRSRSVLALVLTSLPGLALAQALDSNAAVRAEFVQQIEALDAMPAPARASDLGESSTALRNYVLYPYLEAQRLRTPMRFGLAADDTATAAFLQRYADAPWTRDLRRDWLQDLARRRSWDLFLVHYLANRADARLRCERLNALIATAQRDVGRAPTVDLQSSVLDVWMTGTQLPDACVSAFDWARERGWFTQELSEQRARLALQAGNADLADFLLRPLPAERAPQLRSWSRLLKNPERELDSLVAGGLPALQAQDPEAIAATLGKLAKRDPLATAPRLNALLAACGGACPLATPATPAELRRELALGFAWSRMPQAVSAFRMVDDRVLDERSYEWRIRAALWSGDWNQASAWLLALPPALAELPRWRYWRARAMAQQNDVSGARKIWSQLATENGYYALMSARQLGQKPTPVSTSSPKDPLMQQQLAQLQGSIRTRELWLAGRSEWSSLEWGEQLAALDRTQSLQAARLAQTWGAHVQTVAAASKAQVYDDYELLYPRPFETEVANAARASAVPPEWIYAVMRQESLYDPRARSRANALGLLQMLLTTARDTARRQQQPMPSAADLYSPDINTRLGALHLRELLDRYDREFVLVLGAYNAGPRPVRRWRPVAGALDADVWIENVPYNETRTYIQRVIWHAAVFSWRAGGKTQTLDAILQPITPATSNDDLP